MNKTISYCVCPVCDNEEASVIDDIQIRSGRRNPACAFRCIRCGKTFRKRV